VIARLALYAAVAAVLGLATGATLFAQRLEPVSEDDVREVIFEVRSGDSLSAVARRLEREGLVRDARVATWWGRWHGHDKGLHVGEYAFSPSLPAVEILERIAAGRVVTFEVVIPEGLTAAEIGSRIADAGLVDAEAFASAVADPELAHSLGIEAGHLEGYLFPETYRMPRGRSGVDVAQVLVGQFLEAWETVAPKALARGLSMHEVVTLASVVEKETGVDAERPLIASVFANRLRRGMRLESDPTVIYGIRDFDGNLRRSHLDDVTNRYNTYQHAGLPPGPIASPGLEAMRAVVEPADTKYLFFVSKNDGSHHFSPTYREHVNAVKRYQMRRGS
jgi:UPF0755 protein